MSIFDFSRLVAVLAMVPLLASGARITDPIPEPIETGGLILELAPFATVSPSSSRVPRARTSIMRALPDGRLFVNDQEGELHRVADGGTTVYLDVKPQFPAFIPSPGLGTGFQAFAFHPDFAANGKLYTVHTERWNAATVDFAGPTAPVTASGQQGVLVEWTADDPGAETFSGSHRELFRVYFPNSVHGLQEIVFNPTVGSGDPDYGLLYVCVGEGGSYLDGYADNIQRLDSPMGTIFRIDPLGSNATNGAYGIPSDNPWADADDPTILREIYAYGFRNPHRLSWDPGGDHLALVGDIGERNLEELNILVPGANYGFPQREGTFLLQPDRPQDNYDVFPLPDDDHTYGFTYPVAQYDHDEGYAIIGGFVYRGAEIPELDGTYIFGDIKNGRVFYLDVDELAEGSLATIHEARIALNGVEMTMPSVVGNSRVDLRFGLDAANELYFMTKTDGQIRRLVSARRDHGGGLHSDPDNWVQITGFEEGLDNLLIHRAGDAIEQVPDPFGDSENTVLAIRGSGATASSALPAVAGDTVASIYFRFGLADSGSAAAAGPSDAAAVSSINQTQAELNTSSDGVLLLREGRQLTEFTPTLRPRIWYEGWFIFDGETNTYDFYLRGDTFTAPTLIGAELRARLPVVGPLTHFIWAGGEGATGTSAVYYDDLHIDPTARNLSSPVGNQWQLIANFETEEALEQWTLLDVFNQTDGAFDPSSVRWIAEASGNSYLQLRATPAADTRTMALAPLPAPVQVGDVVTLYGRVRPESHAVNVAWGLSNQSPDAFPTLAYDAFESIIRLMDAPSDFVTVRDGNHYLPARGNNVESVALGRWHEYWMVVRNGGEASGGQTFDVYWRSDDSNDEPARVYANAGFRIGRETPVTHFAVIANHGAEGATGSVGFDDLFLIDGVELTRPAGTGIGIFPGPLGSKQIPWFGQIWDNDRPWIYHVDHQWIYVPAAVHDSVWFHDNTLGWLFTTPEIYPHLYSSGQGEWLYYLVDSHAPRWFYGYRRLDWFEDPEAAGTN